MTAWEIMLNALNAPLPAHPPPPPPQRRGPGGGTYHCTKCLVDWVGEPLCWCCGKSGGGRIRWGWVPAPRTTSLSLAATVFGCWGDDEPGPALNTHLVPEVMRRGGQ